MNIKLSNPIRLSPTRTVPLMAIGFLLVLHPLAWILLLQYDRRHEDSSTANSESSGVRRVADAVEYFILDLTPRIANGGLTIFLLGFFFCMGYLKQQAKGS